MERLDPDAAKRLLSTLVEEDSDAACAGLPSVPGYRVLDFIGAGATARVYSAVRDGSGRPVALKLFETGKRVSRERVWRELELLSDLQIEGVPRLVDFGESGGSFFIATELIEGADALTYADARNLTLRERVELLARIADIVQRLHERAVLHRDLKPENVIVDGSGSPHVVDLGLARINEASDGRSLTYEGTPLGTPAYMSPEQARGEASVVSTRTDVFALGAIGFALFTGEPPRGKYSSMHAAVRAAAEDPVRDPRGVRADFPSGLRAVLAKSLDLDPARRYASAQEFVEELRRWLNGEPVLVVPPGPWVRLARWVGRHPIASTTTLATFMGVSIIALSAAVVWWWNMSPSRIRIAPGEVALLSRGGNVLVTWPGSADGNSTGAASFRHDGKLYVAIAHPNGTADPDAACLMLYTRSGMLWSYVPELPPQLRPAAWPIVDAEYMACRRVWADEVVASSPGAEIVSVFWHRPWSPTAITILSPDGNVLREYWHDGYITHLQVDAASGILFGVGTNSEYAFAERETATVSESSHLRVAFAIHLDSPSGIIATPGGVGQVEPLWYLTLCPIDLQAERQRFVPARQHLAFARETLAVTDIQSLQMIFDDAVTASWRYDRNGVGELDYVARNGEEGTDPYGLREASWKPIPRPTNEAYINELTHRQQVWRHIGADDLVKKATQEDAGTQLPHRQGEQSPQ